MRASPLPCFEPSSDARAVEHRISRLDVARSVQHRYGTQRKLASNKSVKDFAADPFFLRRDDKVTLLVEKLDPANNCGSIAAHLIDGGRIVPLGTVIEEPFHSS